MYDRLRVLFLCSANSARSQMAEAILRHLSDGRVTASSAGINPAAHVHPMALEALARLGVDAAGLRPKPVDPRASPGPDLVVTVCDSIREQCPVFPGIVERFHWNIADPAAAGGSDDDRQQAFDRAAAELMTRVRAWLSRPDIAERLT